MNMSAWIDRGGFADPWGFEACDSTQAARDSAADRLGARGLRPCDRVRLTGRARAGDAGDGLEAIQDWGAGYVRRHPLASLTTVGDQFVLGVRTIQYLFIDLFTGRFQWQEFVRQGAFMAGTAVLPTVLVALPIGVTLSIQFALLAGQVGATSLAGAASGLAVIRQAASLTAAILMAAAVGSAITADLGSRKMREETDAMEVMGVSVIRRLVVPRFAAAIMVGVALTGVVCFVGFLASYLFNVYFQNGAPGSFVATFASFATTGDLIVALGEGGDLRRHRRRGVVSEGDVHGRRSDGRRELGECGGRRIDPGPDDRQRRHQPALHHDVPAGGSVTWQSPRTDPSVFVPAVRVYRRFSTPVHPARTHAGLLRPGADGCADRVASLPQRVRPPALRYRLGQRLFGGRRRHGRGGGRPRHHRRSPGRDRGIQLPRPAGPGACDGNHLVPGQHPRARTDRGLAGVRHSGRLPVHRPAGIDAHRRRDRRPGFVGDPAHSLPGDHASDGVGGRGRPAVRRVPCGELPDDTSRRVRHQRRLDRLVPALLRADAVRSRHPLLADQDHHLRLDRLDRAVLLRLLRQPAVRRAWEWLPDMR